MSAGGEFRPTLRERLEYLALRALLRLPDALVVRLSGEPPVVVDGQRLDAQLQLVRAIRRRRNPYTNLTEPTVSEGRRRFRRETLAFRGPRTAVGEVTDRSIATAEGALRARHYTPARHADNAALVVWFHGGGWAIGDLDTHDECCRILCDAGVHVLSVDYRLAPEHPYPAALRDARAAFRWARANARALGATPHRVAVGGDSAGANLAAVVARLGAREGNPPAAQLLVYPVTDLSRHTRSMDLFDHGWFLSGADRRAFRELYLGALGDPADPCISPLRAADLMRLPPALVVTAGFDTLRDEGEAYANALRSAGVPVRAWREPSLSHGFIHMTGVAHAARRATRRFAAEARALLDECAPATID